MFSPSANPVLLKGLAQALQWPAIDLKVGTRARSVLLET